MTIQQKLKPCKCGCGTEGYLFSHGMIKEHWYQSDEYKSKHPKQNYEDAMKAAPQMPRSTIKKKFQKPSGELILFKAIWETRPHVCQMTGEPISEFNVWNFMHILSKGAYPKFRLFDKNILLVTKEFHNEYDNGDRSAPEFKDVMVLHDELIKQYYND